MWTYGRHNRARGYTCRYGEVQRSDTPKAGDSLQIHPTEQYTAPTLQIIQETINENEKEQESNLLRTKIKSLWNDADFTFTKDWLEAIKLLSLEEEQAKAYQAIISTPSMASPRTRKIGHLPFLVFTTTKTQIDLDYNRYKETSNARSRAGKRSAEVRWKYNENNNTNENNICYDKDKDKDRTRTRTRTRTKTKTKTKNKRKEREKEKMEQSVQRLTPPPIDEIKSFCVEIWGGVDPEEFFNYYQANGWKVGKNRMKDWKACVLMWKKRNEKNQKNEKQDTLSCAKNDFF